MGKHTPGPWAWHDDKLIGYGGKQVIGSAPYEGQWFCYEEDEVLVAAAPDLLEAVKELRALIDRVAPEYSHCTVSASADAVIAKAEQSA